MVARLYKLAEDAPADEDATDAETARRRRPTRRPRADARQPCDSESPVTESKLLAALENAAGVDEIAAAACRVAYYIRTRKVCPRSYIATFNELMTWEAPEVRGESTGKEEDIGPAKQEGLRDLAAIIGSDGSSVMWFPLLGPSAVVRHHDEERDDEALSVAEVQRRWKAMPNPRPRHYLLAVASAWQEAIGYPPDQVQVVTLRCNDIAYMRTPGLMSIAALTPVETVTVDGEPFGSAAPVRILRRVPLPPPSNPYPVPGPRTLDGVAADPLLSTLSCIDGDDWMDGGSPIRSDVLMLVRLGCAIVLPVTMDVNGWAQLLRGRHGRVQPLAHARARKALAAAATVVWLNGRSYPMVRVRWEGDAVTVQPSSHGDGWWQGGHHTADAWRLSGGLWRSHWTSAKDGGYRRLAEGIEAWLAWTAPTGHSKNGRIPRALQPVDGKKGNPGPAYRIGWQAVIYLSGEPWPDAADSNARRTYQRRVAAFEQAGYLVPPKRQSAPAPAGDTWEILRLLRGAIFVRASARYVEAVGLSQQSRNFTRVTLAELLRSMPDV